MSEQSMQGTESTRRRERAPWNPIRCTMHLPLDVDLSDIDWCADASDHKSTKVSRRAGNAAREHSYAGA